MPKILVVDDQECQRETVSIVLENRGHEVLTASSSDEVEILFQYHDFDLVITDFTMTDGDNGINVLKLSRIKNSQTPVLVRSGDEAFANSNSWKDFGFDAVSFKVEGNDRLCAKVALLLQGHFRILIIDPQASMRELLTELAKRKDFAVHESNNAEEALQLASQVSFHLITTAGLLDSKTGKELAEVLICKGITSPIALISAYVADIQIPSDKNPFSAQVPKPFRLHMIEQLLEYAKNAQ